MTSQRQLEANRANAKLSTGPKTQSGKARSSINSVKHGVTAKQNVVGDEDPREFEAFQDSLITDLGPVGPFEHDVVGNIGHDLWRLRRVARMEAAVIHAELQAAEAQRQAQQASGGDSIQRLFGKLEGIRRRMRTDSEAKPCDGESLQDQEVPHAEQDKAVKQAPEETRQQSEDRTFAVIVRENKLGALSRYHTSLLNNLTRNFTLLRLAQSFRMKTESSTLLVESVAVRPMRSVKGGQPD